MAIILLAIIIPIKQWAQSPYWPYADNGISLNFFNIDNHDFRLFLLYQLSQDSRFTAIPEEENGMFVVVPSTDEAEDDFLDEFEELYNRSFALFSLLSKNDIFDLVPVWKAGVSPVAFTSITMDLALSRATRENNHCVDSDPFCTSDVITFDAATSEQTADQLEGETLNDGCIGSSYSPAWYHMRINTPGQFIIHMEGHDPNYNDNRDIDFCMWGPYEDPVSPCVAQLTVSKIIDCNYSSSYSEDIYLGYPESEHIHDAGHGTIYEHTPEVGEYYILMITNYSRQPCTISFTKTENSGPGTTDCGILPGIANNDGPYCTGETINLTVTTQAGATYSWTGPDGFTSNQQNPVLTDCTMAMAGTYTCVTTVDDQTTSGSTEVVIYATPEPETSANPASVQYGGVATITANPGAEGNFNYHWEPADMVVDPNSPTTQTVALIETQTYTVTVTNVDGDCVNSTQLTVVMAGSNMTATATADQDEICEGSSTTLHAVPVAGTGNYTYNWSPANSLSDPNIQNPVASPELGTTIYTCLVSDGIVEAEVSVSITVHPQEASEIHQTICEGTSYNFFGQQISEIGTYHHTLQTIHGCDSIVTLHLGINYPEESNFTVPDTENCDAYFWDPMGHEIIESDHEGLVYTESGLYHRTYRNHADCDSIVTMEVHFEYTPSPTPIYPTDPENTAPHWVVTATEFQINTYEFHLWDTNPHCHWDTVTWSFENNADWIIEPFGNKGQSCRMTVLNHMEDTVWLRATAFNRCTPDEGVSQRYWFVCSFYGVDENGPSTGSETFDFNVLPNPNNGQMTLNFERLTSKVDVKVYDMRGSLIDQFETFNGDGLSTYEYQMKQATNGIYFFVATGKEGTMAKKVVVQQ
ncbi:MAG: T9SS type A sorting domain-containing protein [Bacteroidales bacterium]|nr:T9SS type A sorting domain-containing protein [Bacteroidales bacterium]